jgi:hypothetical protein
MYFVIFIVFLWLAYKWSVDNFDYYEKLGLPFEKPLPLFGNMFNIIFQKESMVSIAGRNYKNFKDSK